MPLSNRNSFPLSDGAKSNTDLRADEMEISEERKSALAIEILSEGQMRRERQIAMALTGQIENLERERTVALQALADAINAVTTVDRKLTAIKAGKWSMDRDAQIIFDTDTNLQSPPALPEIPKAEENKPGTDLAKLATYGPDGKPKLGYRPK